MNCPKPRRASACSAPKAKGIALAQRQMIVVAANDAFDQTNNTISGSTMSGPSKASMNGGAAPSASSQVKMQNQPMRRCRSATSIRGKVAEAAASQLHGTKEKHPLHAHSNCFKMDSDCPPTRLKLSTKAGLHSFKTKRACISGPSHATATRRHDGALKHRMASPTAQLEMEFIDRMRHIDSLQVPNKSQIRLQVARDILDEIVLQDTTYGCMLGAIRDIFNEFLSYDEPSYSCLTKELESQVVDPTHEVDECGKPNFFAAQHDGGNNAGELSPPVESPHGRAPPTVPRLNFASLHLFQDD